MQTRQLVRQIARMQETLNVLNERLESIDRREAKHHRIHHDGEGGSDEVDGSFDEEDPKTFL